MIFLKTNFEVFKKMKRLAKGLCDFSLNRNGRFKIQTSQPRPSLFDLWQTGLVQPHERRFNFILRPRNGGRRPLEPQRTLGSFLSRPRSYQSAVFEKRRAAKLLQIAIGKNRYCAARNQRFHL